MNAARASPRSTQLTEQILAGDQMRLVIAEVAESPELRTAMTQETTGLMEEVVGGVRARAIRLDDRLERSVGRARPRTSRYAGAATRAVALAFDGALTYLAGTVVVYGPPADIDGVN